MGKQYDKVLKRRRRHAYLERRKQKAKEAVAAAARPRTRKPPVRKAAPRAEAPAEPVENTAAGAAAELPGAEEIAAAE